jgi:hypothetical protein
MNVDDVPTRAVHNTNEIEADVDENERRVCHGDQGQRNSTLRAVRIEDLERGARVGERLIAGHHQRVLVVQASDARVTGDGVQGLGQQVERGAGVVEPVVVCGVDPAQCGERGAGRGLARTAVGDLVDRNRAVAEGNPVVDTDGHRLILRRPTSDGKRNRVGLL